MAKPTNNNNGGEVRDTKEVEAAPSLLERMERIEKIMFNHHHDREKGVVIEEIAPPSEETEEPNVKN